MIYVRFCWHKPALIFHLQEVYVSPAFLFKHGSLVKNVNKTLLYIVNNVP